MSNKTLTPGSGPQEIAPENVDGISGGLCSGDELKALTDALKDSYENLVDFVSHVIGRVSGN